MDTLLQLMLDRYLEAYAWRHYYKIEGPPDQGIRELAFAKEQFTKALEERLNHGIETETSDQG